jgi:hypothetical protein
MMRLRRHCIWHPLLVASLAVLGASEAAEAHVGGKLKGFVSTVTGVTPEIAGLRVVVIGGGTRLRLSNQTGKTIVIFGYQHDPYLRFGSTGVYVNMHSPTSYATGGVNSGKAMPPTLTAATPPLWDKVAGGRTYIWHDNRIHWGGDIPPPSVKAAPDKPHAIRHWKVPGLAGGKPLAISGFLGYTPPPGARRNRDSSRALPAALLGVAGVGLVAAALVVARRRKRARRTGAAGS